MRGLEKKLHETKIVTPTDKDNIIGGYKQIQLPNMWMLLSSEAELRSTTGKHICKLDVKGTVDYESSSVRQSTELEGQSSAYN